MTDRRRSPKVSPDRRPSPASDESESVSPSPPARQRTVRITRRATTPSSAVRKARATTTVQIASGSGSPVRRRRPTPIVRRNRNRPSDFEVDPDASSSPSPWGSDEEEQQQKVTADRSIGGGKTSTTSVKTTRSGRQNRNRPASDGQALSWYERLMPEFLLNMTSPITGYESQLLDDELDEMGPRDAELVERRRLKRNRRVRRRLLTIMLVAALAGAFFYYRGRLVRRTGVKAALGEMKHRLEDGFSKTLHDMGK